MEEQQQHEVSKQQGESSPASLRPAQGGLGGSFLSAGLAACLLLIQMELADLQEEGREKKKRERKKKQTLRNSIKAVASFRKRKILTLNVVSVPFFCKSI